MEKVREELIEMLKVEFPQLHCAGQQKGERDIWAGHYFNFDSNKGKHEDDEYEPPTYVGLQLYIYMYDGRYIHYEREECDKYIKQVAVRISQFLASLTAISKPEFVLQPQRRHQAHTDEQGKYTLDIVNWDRYVAETPQFEIYYEKESPQVVVRINQKIVSEEERILNKGF